MVILKKWKEPKRRETFTPYYVEIRVPYRDLDKYLTKTSAVGYWKANYTLFGREWKGHFKNTENDIRGWQKLFNVEGDPDFVTITLVWPSASNNAYVSILPAWQEFRERY